MLVIIVHVAVKLRLLMLLAFVQLFRWFVIVYGDDDFVWIVLHVLRLLCSLLCLLSLWIHNSWIVAAISALRALAYVVARKRVLAVRNQALRAYKVFSVLHGTVFEV